ncbi:ribosomal protein L7/L12 [Gimesia fumaroli]|uniref:50S ribosomal protein L7/L12 n=1 Tax=Gimesia fumaroli TaxID=2527976 RepID=A0A518IC57_9PLAN|nr:ribosomal protein L7/L12 [Gimesia fumaroli]QDV50609.1 50S ribosomal protein L7/L12 [Gimesia fumaroli]
MNDSDSHPPEESGAADDQSELVEQIVNSLKQGNKIQAIKDYRESTGAGLKESKEVIDELIQKYDISMKSGCASMILVTISATFLLVYALGR